MENKSLGNSEFKTSGYRLEIRCTHSRPLAVGGFIIHAEWQMIPVGADPKEFGANIPIRAYDGQLLRHGLLSRIAVEALRWWVLALLEASTSTGVLCVETRVVEVKLTETWNLTLEGESEPQSALAYLRGTVAPSPREAAHEPEKW